MGKNGEEMNKIIVSGADGFIGVNFIKSVIEKNIEVWAIIYPGSMTKDRVVGLKNVHCVECDISELKEYIDEFPKDADAFYHFAWQGVNAKQRDNMEIQKGNIDICLSAITFASMIHVKRFILPGSTSEYLYYGQPINENALPCPLNAYGSVKIALRFMAEQYAQQCGIEFIYTVITGIYAADRKDNNVIFYVINSLLKGQKPSVTKLEQLWDYVNIKDVVEALYLVGDKGVSGAFYAIGHGDNWPLYKYIEIIRDNIDPRLPVGIGEVPYKDERLPSSCMDLTRLKNDTGFEPKISFEVGIMEVIEKMREEQENE